MVALTIVWRFVTNIPILPNGPIHNAQGVLEVGQIAHYGDVLPIALLI